MGSDRPRPPVAALITGLADRIGVAAFVDVCADLVGGAPRERYVEELRALTGHGWLPGDGVLDATVWHDHWLRTWGARGLLHVWDDAATATAAVVTGLGDDHWRPAEMCLKVAARHEVAGTADAAARLAGDELTRVRAAAVRALGVVGDTEHVEVVRAAADDPSPAVRRAAGLALERLAARLDL